MTEEWYLEEERRRPALTVRHCGQEACRPGHSYGPAVRDHYLVHLVLSGKGIYRYADTELSLGAGDGFLILPGERTFYQADVDDPWAYVWVGFDGYEAKRLLADCGLDDQTRFFHAREMEALEQEFFGLVSLFQQPVGAYAILAQFYRVVAQMEQPRLRKTGGADYFEKAAEYIRRNYSYHLQIADLAAHIGVDRTYLYKLFLREAGMSPQEYLIRYRLQEACELLKNSTLTASEVALSCGFQDVPSFYKQFQRRMGQTPMNYRRNAKTKTLDEVHKIW